MPSESEFIAAFLAPFGGGEGVGSDCASVRVGRGLKLVATTDAVVQDVHFTLPGFSPEEVGWKALAVNLSDLAAAGARPRWFLCALGVPESPRALQRAVRMAKGMAVLARRFGCALVGGNVSRAAQWSLTLTALGEARRPLTRTGARPGDALVVVGTLGDAAAGLRGSRRGLSAQRRPLPLVNQGMAAARFASASIDVSDGFLRDLGHLCEQSGCGATVEVTHLPLGPAARSRADGFDLALTGGEDYALLYAVPQGKLAALRRAVRCEVVGQVVRGRRIALLQDGVRRRTPSATGYDHLQARGPKPGA